MSAGNLPQFTPPEPTEPPPPGAKEVKLCLAVCFDGTLNNRVNINQRLLAASDDKLTGEERKAAAELKEKASAQEIEDAKETYRKYGAKRPDEENSYEGFYTNIEKLQRYLEVGRGKPKDHDFSFAIYVEGIGTLDKDADRQGGYAFGAWKTGIPRKVEWAMGEVIRKIRYEEGIAPDAAIARLTVEVLGFSRGATAARNFIYEARYPDEGQKSSLSLQQRLQRAGRHAVPANIRLAGLFDTVSTYGPGIIGAIKVAVGSADNVRQLNLDAVADAEKVLHLTAADEYRYHFSLTNIESAGGKGFEYCLPGAHSDIGGGYRDEAFEQNILRGAGGITDVILHGNYIAEEEAKAERQALIEQGFCREEEIEVVPRHDTDGRVMYATLTSNRRGRQTQGPLAATAHEIAARRANDAIQRLQVTDPMQRARIMQQALNNVGYEGVRNGYSKIPLHIMVNEMRKLGWKFMSKFIKDESIPEDLQAIYDRLVAYCTGASKPDPAYWRNNQEPWMKALRRDYLHLSARMQPGHDPRIENGKRTRKVYPG